MTSQPPVVEDQPATEAAPEAAVEKTRRVRLPKAPRVPVGQVLRQLDWPILLLVGVGAGAVWVLLLLQGGAIQILAGLVPVTGGIFVGRRVARRANQHINWHAALLGIIMAGSALAAVSTIIAIESQRAAGTPVSPLLLQAAMFAIVTLLPFPAFGVITAARSEQRQREQREQLSQRGGKLDRPGRVKTLEELRSLSLPQLGGYVADLFRKHGFLVDDYRFEKDRLEFMMTHEQEPWIIRVYTAEKIKPGVAQDLTQRMRGEGVKKGVVVTSMDFQDAAVRWAKDKPIVLIDGPTLLSMND
jgi:hypothetical protein